MLREKDSHLNFGQSLDPLQNYQKIQKAGNSVDETGQFLFNTHDNQLVAKSISREELSTIKKSLKDYAKHLDRNPRTLLTKIYCLLTIEFKSLNSQ